MLLGFSALLRRREAVVWWTFGEFTSVRQEPPDDAGPVAGDDHQGVAVALAAVAVFLIDAPEAGMFACHDKGGKVQRPAECGRTAIADLAVAVDGVVRAAGTGVEARVGDVLVRRQPLALSCCTISARRIFSEV